jgi:methyl-accepting chemotaxis protein
MFQIMEQIVGVMVITILNSKGWLELKLRSKIVISVFVMFCITLMAVSGFSYLNVKELLLDNIISEMHAVVNGVSMEVDGWLNTKAKTVETTGLIIQASSKDGEITKNHLQAFKNDPHIYDIYIGFDENGGVLDGGDWVAPDDYDARTRPWYKEAVKANDIVYSLTYGDEANGWKNVLSSSIPIKGDNGKVFGVVAGDMYLSQVSNIISDIKTKEESYAILLDDKGVVLAHPDKEMLSKDFLNDEAIDQNVRDLTSEMLSDEDEGNIYHSIDGEERLMVYRKVPSTGWVIGVSVAKSEIYKPLNSIKSKYLMINGIALFFIILCSLYFARYLIKPIRELTTAANVISSGDLTVDIKVKSNDEIGELGKAFNTMLHNLKELINHVNVAAIELSASSQQMAASSEQYSAMTDNIANNINRLVEDEVKQSSDIERTNYTIKEMAEGIQQVAINAQSTNEVGIDARRAIENGKDTIDKAVKNMREIEVVMKESVKAAQTLGENSNEIGNIVQMITDIAGQTNLLALNAAIEAARAGEQGKGFAVVADEVRKLAEESSNATQKISSLIENVQSETKRTVDLMKKGDKSVEEGSNTVMETGAAFDEIHKAIEKITSGIEEVSATTEEMSAGSDEIVTSIDNINDIKEKSAISTKRISDETQEQMASIEEIASSAKKLAVMAQELQDQINKFKM